MTYWAFSALVNFITSLSLGSFIFFKNPKRQTNYVFALFSFAVAFWSLSYYFWQIATDESSALLWSKALMAFAIFIPILYLHFIFGLLGIVKKRVTFLALSYLIFTFFLLLDLFTSHFIFQMKPLLYFKFWPIPGVAFQIFLPVWGAYLIYSTYFLHKIYKNSTGLIKIQTKYLFWGLLTGFIGGLTNYFLWYRIFIPPIGNILVSAYVIVTGYAIIRHRFLNITLAIRSVLIYLISSIILGLIIFDFHFITGTMKYKDISLIYLVEMLVISLFLAILLPIIFKAVALFLDKTYFGRTISSQDSLMALAEELPKILDISRLADVIINTLINTMGLTRAAVLIVDNETKRFRIAKTIGFDENNGISIVEDNFLTQFLEKNKKILVIEELEKMAEEVISPDEKSKLRELINYMIHIEAALIIPVITNNKLISLIVLGNKKGGDVYTVEDVKLLKIIASQSATAFENARLYREVSYFNQHLKQKVDEATSELQKKNNDLKEANIQIGLTGKLKEDLLAMASHEFRTPITNIKNMLWMLQKQDLIAKLNDNEKQKFDRLSKAVERLDYVVRNINQMLNATSGNLEEQLHFDSVQIERIIKEVIEDKEIEAKEALVNLVYNEPQNLLPPIEADPVKLQYCLYELITNALKYTDKNGSITVTTELQENSVIIKILDTGKGIPSEHIPTLFQGFDKIDVIHTSQSGMGLGLYIVAKIINLHKGKISIESTVGKGTTFTIELPIQKVAH